MSRPGYVYHLREPVGYQEGWEMQRRLADAVSRGAMPDTVLSEAHRELCHFAAELLMGLLDPGPPREHAAER